jgi:hypothetical protein
LVDQIKNNEMGGACSTCGGEERCIRGLGGKSKGTILVGISRPRWKDNIKMDLQEVGWGMDGIVLAEDRDRWRCLVDAVMNLRVS